MNHSSKTYTCPMHPEIVASTPGKCPKCGMALVISGKQEKTATRGAGDKVLGTPWQSYLPLIVVILMITAVSGIVSWRGNFSFSAFIVNFMTGFFLVFSGFKLMDLKGFAEGYSTYDILAQKWCGYGYIYPFIELVFGLLMLSGFHPLWLLWIEFGVMIFSGFGVARKLARHEKFQCACLGTFLKVPLTYVTLIEDFGMAFLALLLIFL